MPPSKKKAASSAPSTATLVARLSRHDLELLLVQSVDGGAVALDRVLALLPESKQGGAVPRAGPVAAGAARTGTGFFDEISDDVLIPMILARLPSKDRFTCAQTVCKSWRSLRDAAELWRELSITCDKPNGFGRMDGPSVQRLVAWLRHPESVTKLNLSAGDSIAPDAIKKTLSAMPSLTSLHLSGKKVTNAVLVHASKQPMAKSLSSLSLADITGSVHATEASKLLLALPGSLTSLVVPNHLVNEVVLGDLGGEGKFYLFFFTFSKLFFQILKIFFFPRG